MLEFKYFDWIFEGRDKNNTVLVLTNVHLYSAFSDKKITFRKDFLEYGRFLNVNNVIDEVDSASLKVYTAHNGEFEAEHIYDEVKMKVEFGTYIEEACPIEAYWSFTYQNKRFKGLSSYQHDCLVKL